LPLDPFSLAILYPITESSIVVGGLSLFLIIGLLFAYYGKERQYFFTKAEVEAAEYLYSHAVPNTLLVEGSRNYPSQFQNYEYFTYVPIDREPSESRERVLADPVGKMREWLSDSRYAVSYLIITRSQMAFVDTEGIMPPGSLKNIADQLRESEDFEVVYSNQDAVIFKVREDE
jgi:hypothetical protein